MRRIISCLFLVLTVTGLSTAQAGTLYKWVDRQGRVSYHDTPPPEGSEYRVEQKSISTGTRETDDNGVAKIAEKSPVMLYSVPVCGSCDLARIYLQNRKVPFSEQNLEDNVELQQKLKAKFGALSAPTITIGDKVMKGYVESILEGELDAAGYPKMETPDAAKKAATDKPESTGTGDTGHRPARRTY